MARDPSRLRLGGENREVTILFADLRGFSSLSERLSAEDVVQFLNTLHTPLTRAVLANNGAIDKYLGDGLMAIFNAPMDDLEHVQHACRAALDMQASIASIEAGLPERIRTALEPGPLSLGVGIATGRANVGNVGSEMRFDYSAVGDVVNVAARLEELTKSVGVSIVVSEKVALLAQDAFTFRPPWLRLPTRPRRTVVRPCARRQDSIEALVGWRAWRLRCGPRAQSPND